jgi:hypothetical protein
VTGMVRDGLEAAQAWTGDHNLSRPKATARASCACSMASSAASTGTANRAPHQRRLLQLEKALVKHRRSLRTLLIEVSPPTLICPAPCAMAGRRDFQHSYTPVGASVPTGVLRRRRRDPSVSFRPSVGIGLIDAESTIISDGLDGRVDPAWRKFPTGG